MAHGEGKEETARFRSNGMSDWNACSAVRLVFVAALLSFQLSLHAQEPVSAASRQPSTDRPDAIGAYLQPLIENHTIAGAVTLVATKDRILYLQAAGYRDLLEKAAMPANAMFWIASTSKPMTVTAFMMLVDEGKVRLDDPVEKYLPEFHGQMVKVASDDKAQDGPVAPGAQASSQLVPASHPILVREILSHTSGLPFKSSAQPSALDTLSLKDSVLSFAAEPLIFQPGTSYSYSNEGIDTAARIIEVVSGLPYEKFMQERLFDPLGMKDTTFWPDDEQMARLAETYKLDPKTNDLVKVQISQLTYPLNDREHRFPMPAGGLFSTAADVSKFCQMILNGGAVNGVRYISHASLHAMTSVQNHGMKKTDYGFGWFVSQNAIGHGGANKNVMDIDTDKGRIFIFMVQQDGPWGTPAGSAMVPTLQRLADDPLARPPI
jgi:CubicO group peptidase (beta-lactamase class C family)